MQKAIFLDRDDTVVVNKHYLSDPEQLEWMKNAVTGLKLLQEKGFDLFLVTNQSGVGRGIMTIEQLHEVHDYLQRMMVKAQLQPFKEIIYCPHHPEDLCSCRKPEPGMLETLFKKYAIDKKDSWMIGDRDVDALAGKSAGLNVALIGERGKIWAEKNQVKHFDDLLAFGKSL